MFIDQKINLAIISSNLKKTFEVEDITVKKVNIKNNYLQILLEANNIPEQEKCIAYVSQQLTKLNIESKVKIYGQQRGEDFPDWIQEIFIEKSQNNLTELAQKRDLEAIINFLDSNLEIDDTTIKASWRDNCLQIILLSNHEIDEKFANLLKTKIFDLEIKKCNKLKIFSKQIDEDFPDWIQEFVPKKSHNVIDKKIDNSSTESKFALAKQGDPNAVTHALNYLLKDREITAKVSIKNNYLQITIQGNQTPDQESLVPYIINFVKKLELAQIHNLQIYAWRKGATFKSWSQTISLVESNNNSLSVWDSVSQTATSVGESLSDSISSSLVYASKSALDTVTWASNTVGNAALQATDGVGYLFEIVTNNSQLKELTKKLNVDWLIQIIDRVDIVKAETEVRELQGKYPNEKPAEISHRIIVTKAMYAGGSGLASSFLPGFAAAMFTVDLAANMLLQAEMIYQIACAYGLNIQDSARKGEVLAIFGLSLGGSQVLKSGSRYAIKAGLGFLRNIPAAGAAIGASTNALMIYSLGYGACRFYEAKATPITMKATLEDIQEDSSDYLEKAIEQEVIIDQILVHVALAGNPDKNRQTIINELKKLNLSPASLETISDNIQSLPSLEELLDRLNQDFAIALFAQCQKVANLDNVITPEEAKIIAKVAQKINVD